MEPILYGSQNSFGGEFIGADTYCQLRAFNYSLSRIDAQEQTADTAGLLAIEAQAAGLQPLVILKHPDQLAQLPDYSWVEPGNEPDLNGPKATEYLIRALAFAGAANDTIQLWAPCISNLTKTGFAYLRSVASHLPARYHISIHRYPRGPFPNLAHPGCQSREDEVAQLKAAIGGRPYGVSECGFHTAMQPHYPDWRKNFRRWDIRLTDEQVAAFYRIECAFWHRHGAQFVTLYQLADGPTDTPKDRAGIRRLDGSWKLCAQR